MKLSQLKMLVAVADHGSFSAAAVELDCTQSRISHAVAELERVLGTRLLTRAREGSAPTDAGHRVLEKARQMLRLEQSLLEAARDGCDLAGHVRIACFRSVGTHLLPYALEALAHAYPGIRVDIDDSCEQSADVAAALRQGRAEIGIVQLPVDSEFLTYPYVHDSYMLVVPASLKPSVTHGWPELEHLPFVELGCAGAEAILERCRAAGFSALPGRRLSNETSVASMVGRGMGYSILPRMATFPEPAEVRVLPLPIPARRQFAIAGLPETLRAPAVKTVLRFIRDRKVVARTRASQAGIIGWE